MKKGLLKTIIGWLVGVLIVGVLIEVIGSMVYDSYKSIFFSSTNSIWAGCVWLWNTCLMFKIPIWSVIIIVLATLTGYILIRRWLNRKNYPPESADEDDDDYLEYTQDRFGKDNTLWGWDWINNKIRYTAPICPRCGTKTMIDLYRSKLDGITTANCAKCRIEELSHTVMAKQSVQDVQQEIVRRINSDEYKQALPMKQKAQG